VTPRAGISLAVIAVLWIAARLAGPAGGAAPAAAPEPRTGVPAPWPAHVTLGGAPAPPAVGLPLADNVRARFAGMNTMWAAAFAQVGARYPVPRLDVGLDEVRHLCGPAPSAWAGLYCSDRGQILIDLAGPVEAQTAGLTAHADQGIAYVVAHEVSHHVQHLRAGGARPAPGHIVRWELQAECLAGVWGRAAGLMPPPPWTYHGDSTHGSAEEQRHWTERGYASGRPATCDGVWSGVSR
jgi:uncharacterized protein